MIPPYVVKALKGHHAGIVYLMLFGVTAGALTKGAPWAAVLVALAIVAVFYEIACRRVSAQEDRRAERRMEQSSARRDTVKMKHRDLLEPEQQILPLSRQRPTLDPPRDQKREEGS